MACEIKEIHGAAQKADICDKILRALPAWFGIEESIVDYVAGVQELEPDKPFYAVIIEGAPVGFVSVKVHNSHTAEIYVMGILEEHHGCGIGKRLVETCEAFCIEHGMEFLTVKTLDESHPDVNYAKTRLFYQAVGFKPLEVFPLLWDEANPCLFLAKNLAK